MACQDSLDHSSRKRPSLGGHTGHHAHRNGIVDDGDSNDTDDAARDCAKGRATLVSDRGWRSCVFDRQNSQTDAQKPCSTFMTATGMTEMNDSAKPERISVLILM